MPIAHRCPPDRLCETCRKSLDDLVAFLEPAEATPTQPVFPSNSSALSFGAAGEWLFDGHAVLQELKDHERLFVSPEAVSAVLDAVVRLTKKAR